MNAATQTAMSSAFEKAGYSKADMILFTAATTYLQSGGTVDRAAEVFAEAYKRLRGDQLVRDSHSNPVASTANGAGQHNVAPRTMGARAAREPSAQERAASGAVARTVAITVLDTYRIRDGRCIGDVSYGEIERLRTANASEAAVFDQILKHVTSADHAAKVRDLIKVKDLQRFIQNAARLADA